MPHRVLKAFRHGRTSKPSDFTHFNGPQVPVSRFARVSGLRVYYGQVRSG